jgi:hypothetical protein
LDIGGELQSGRLALNAKIGDEVVQYHFLRKKNIVENDDPG